MRGQTVAQVSNPLRQVGEHLYVSGPLTLETVPALEKALSSLRPGIRQVDLSALTRVDSAALAWLLALCERAEGGPPVFLHAPKNLRVLAQLYELDFLHFAPQMPENAA
ncbi:MAG TPA: STAS domain-containing protein [Piscirickettsiaceae bacterium]|nr:STAS domain-containing protein [Piscirickettsiaceae bacterium]HIQ40018.1 STAS domain-containing protein [Sulfurivirga caldicuralii]